MNIIDSFTDGTGQYRAVSPVARAALLAAMGVESEEDLVQRDDRVLIVYEGDEVELDGTAELVLEDGTSLGYVQTLPNDLPLGYHALRRADDRAPARVIVCPRRCYFDETLRDWGWAIQLYSVRSRQSWGIGDLADLRQLAHWSAELGAGLLLLGPLGAVTPVLPQQPSPYFPISRRFRNPIYLRIEDVPGASISDSELQRLATEARQLNDDRHTDHDAVFQRKLAALEHIWSSGVADTGFDAFCQEQGESLWQCAVYCVLAEEIGGDWRRWPER